MNTLHLEEAFGNPAFAHGHCKVSLLCNPLRDFCLHLRRSIRFKVQINTLELDYGSLQSIGLLAKWIMTHNNKSLNS